MNSFNSATTGSARSASRSASFAAKSPGLTVPWPRSIPSIRSRMANSGRHHVLIIRSASSQMRTEIMSSGSAPSCRFTPRRLISAPSPWDVRMTVQRGQVSGAVRATITSTDKPAWSVSHAAPSSDSHATYVQTNPPLPGSAEPSLSGTAPPSRSKRNDRKGGISKAKHPSAEILAY